VSHVDFMILLSWSWVVVDRLSMRLVPDELWALVEPLVPEFRARPQGGGTAPLPARAVFTAIVYVLTDAEPSHSPPEMQSASARRPVSPRPGVDRGVGARQRRQPRTPRPAPR
jgi:hypothetical protein